MDHEHFHAEVLHAYGARLVVVFQKTCAVCQALFVRLSRQKAQLAGDLPLFRIDAEASPELAGILRVVRVPALFIFKHGQLEMRIEGIVSEGVLLAILRDVIRKNETVTSQHESVHPERFSSNPKSARETGGFPLGAH